MVRTARISTFLIAAVLLCAVVPSPASAAPQNLIKYFFLNTGVQPAAEGKIHFMSNKAQTFFTIKLSNTIPGTYDIVLNSAIVDTIVVNSDGEGKVFHRAKNGNGHGNGNGNSAISY